MQISGAAYLHGPQSINQPHRAGGMGASRPASAAGAVDQLDISSEAKAASEALKSGEIRQDRVAQARQRIESGFYDNDEVLESALGRMLDDLAG
jgi:anti-sigma28 factor (negative regulator of flagellin synthesis)